jgi:hypothetical protein
VYYDVIWCPIWRAVVTLGVLSERLSWPLVTYLKGCSNPWWPIWRAVVTPGALSEALWLPLVSYLKGCSYPWCPFWGAVVTPGVLSEGLCWSIVYWTIWGVLVTHGVLSQGLWWPVVSYLRGFGDPWCPIWRVLVTLGVLSEGLWWALVSCLKTQRRILSSTMATYFQSSATCTIHLLIYLESISVYFIISRIESFPCDRFFEIDS